MKADEELNLWRQHWRAQPSVPMDLFRKVEKGTRGMRYYRTAEILVTVMVGGGTAAVAFVTQNVSWIALAGGTWVLILLAWYFSLRYTRGIWAPSAPTTASYLDLSIRRCQWRMKDARYDIVQSVAVTAFVLVVDYFIITDIRHEPPSLWLLGILFFVIAPGLVVGFELKRRKAKSEMDSLISLQRQLQENN
jgi:hypothetical protein